MSFDTLRKVVSEHFISGWTPDNKYIDFGGNNKFDPPKDKTAWVRLNVIPFVTLNAEVGTGFQRTEGEILVQCFVAAQNGEKAISIMDDAVIAIFQNKNFSGVRCFATSVSKIGTQANWYQHNVSTVFQYDVFS